MEKQLIQLTPEILQYLTDFLVSDKKLSKNDQDLVIRIFKSALKNLLDVYKKQKDFDKFNNQEVLYLFSELLDYSLGELQCFNLLHPNQAITSEAEDILAQRASDKFLLLRNADTSPVNDNNMDYYDPRISTLRALEFYLESINRPLAHTNPTVSLINDIFETIFRKIAGYCKMMTLGLYPDGFVSWRTLHESECIVSLLISGGDQVRYSYIKHIAYNNALRNQSFFSKEELDKTFEQLKNEMRDHNLKSKDMKKFIEYGWLYDHPKYDPNDVLFKLNFRDGVEKLSGLSEYSKIYEGASEIAHSSSAFFYVNDASCKDISLSIVYQSAIRISELYLTYMKDYFEHNQEKKKKALLFLSDAKTISKYLDAQVSNIEVSNDDQEEN
jgi:hypothetical protein